jgi:fumarate reductase flavoprotein subunit
MKLDRRSFLKGSLVAGAAAIAGTSALAGCSPGAATGNGGSGTSGTDAASGFGTGAESASARLISIESALPTESAADIEQLDYDVLVIGGGTSGSCAALAAAEQGAKVLIVEKSSITGGLSNYSGFVAGAETALQKEAGYDITVDYLYTVHREYYKGTCYLPLVRNIFKSTSDTIDWLQKNGLGLIPCPPFLSVQSNLPRNQELCGHLMTGPNRDVIDSPYLPSGNFQGLYSTYLEDYKGEVMTETRAIKLLISEDGQKITGAICEQSDGTQLQVNAKAVVLSAGSWNGDTDYLRYNLAHNPIYNQEAISVNTGDGIAIAEAIGAQPWISSPFWHQVYISQPDGTEDYSLIFRENTILCRMPVFMWVTPEGERFCDETVAGDFSRFANTAMAQGGSYWLLLDEAMVDDLEANGTPVDIIGSSPGDNTAKTGTEEISSAVGAPSGPMTGLKKLLDDYVAEGTYIKATDLDDLASQTGCIPEVLKASVSTYNDAVAAKQDALYLKDPKYLHYSYGSGPFYALKATANCEGGSLGGVRVNKDLMVMRRETGKPFDNLWATGLNAAGFFGVGGYVDICGCTMGFATNSGRLAGEQAGELVKG